MWSICAHICTRGEAFCGLGEFVTGFLGTVVLELTLTAVSACFLRPGFNRHLGWNLEISFLEKSLRLNQTISLVKICSLKGWLALATERSGVSWLGGGHGQSRDP